MIQLHGAIGITWEHPAHRYLKRAHSGMHLFGTPAQHAAAIQPASSTGRIWAYGSGLCIIDPIARPVARMLPQNRSSRDRCGGGTRLGWCWGERCYLAEGSAGTALMRGERTVGTLMGACCWAHVMID